VILGVLAMSHSLPLFNAPISDEEIRRPHICATVGELIHCARQQNISFDNQQMLGLECANRWLQSGEPFTYYLALWPDGNWMCFHDYVYRDRDNPVAPGQFQNGYYVSRDESKHFYHLETNTARDLILQR
jgi:hypothetical protein